MGSPVANRSGSEFAEVVGYFVNPVVLRGRLDGDPAFRGFLNQVRETVLGAMEHQDFPFPWLVDRLQPKRDPSYSPIFQVSFALQKPMRTAGSADRLGYAKSGPRSSSTSLELEPFEVAQAEGQFDLYLEMTESEGELLGTFKYNTDL